MSTDDHSTTISVSEEVDVVIVNSDKCKKLKNSEGQEKRVESALRFGFGLIDSSSRHSKKPCYLEIAQEFVKENRIKVQLDDDIPKHTLKVINGILDSSLHGIAPSEPNKDYKLMIAVNSCLDGDYCGLLDDLSRQVIMFAWIVNMSSYKDGQTSKQVIVLPYWLVYEWYIGHILIESFSKVYYQKRIKFMNNVKKSKQLYIVPDFICEKDQEIVVFDAKLSGDWKYIRDCFYQMRSYISSLEKCRTGYLIINGMDQKRCGRYESQITNLINNEVSLSGISIEVVYYDISDENVSIEGLTENYSFK